MPKQEHINDVIRRQNPLADEYIRETHEQSSPMRRWDYASPAFCERSIAEAYAAGYKRAWQDAGMDYAEE